MKKLMYCMAFASMFAFASCGGAKTETTEEKVENAVEQVVDKAEVAVEKAEEVVEEVAEDAAKLAENETLLEAYEKLVKSAEELKANADKKDVLGSVAKIAEVKKNADNVGDKIKEAKDGFSAEQKAKYEELKARLEAAFK